MTTPDPTDFEEYEDGEDDLSASADAADAEPVERLRIQTDKRQAPLRIDKFLMIRVEGATRNKIQQAIEAGLVTVNGSPVKPNFKVKGEMDIVVYDYRRPETTEIVPEDIPLSIVYEDESLLVINKPAGMVVHPGSGNYTGT